MAHDSVDALRLLARWREGDPTISDTDVQLALGIGLPRAVVGAGDPDSLFDGTLDLLLHADAKTIPPLAVQDAALDYVCGRIDANGLSPTAQHAADLLAQAIGAQVVEDEIARRQCIAYGETDDLTEFHERHGFGDDVRVMEQD